MTNLKKAIELLSDISDFKSENLGIVHKALELAATPEKQTDLQHFLELYKKFNIKLTPVKHSNIITIELKNGFKGYEGFYSVITFDLNENFLEQAFYE